MFADARRGDACVVNADDAYVRAMRIPPGCRVASFGEDERAALEDERGQRSRPLLHRRRDAVDVRPHRHEASVHLRRRRRRWSRRSAPPRVCGGFSLTLRVALTEPGARLAPCAAAAAAAALSLGADLGPALADAMRSCTPPPRAACARSRRRPNATRASRASTTRTTPTPRASRTRSRRFAPSATPGGEPPRCSGTCSSSGRVARVPPRGRSRVPRPRVRRRGLRRGGVQGRRRGCPGGARGCGARVRRGRRGRALARGGGGGDEGGREGTRRRPRQGKPIHAHGPRRPQAHRGGGGGGGGRRGGAKEGRRGGEGVAW